MTLTPHVRPDRTDFRSLHGDSSRSSPGLMPPMPEPTRKTTTRRGELTFRFTPRHGAQPTNACVRYSLHGAVDAPVVIALGGISAGRDVCDVPEQGIAGWWPEVTCRDGALDPRHYRVLGVDWLDRGVLGTALAVDSADQADALAALLDALGVARVAAVVGCSYGAMVGLWFAARHPGRLDRLVAISGAHRAHPMATALRAIQRGIVRAGIGSGDVGAALALARQLAMTSYRGSEEFASRFDGPPEFRDGRFRFPVEDYLENAGLKFVARFDARRFLDLSESIDLHRIEPESIRVPTTVIGVDSDRLVPLADLIELSERIQGPCRFASLASPYGHDAFLKEPVRIGAAIRRALTDATEGAAP